MIRETATGVLLTVRVLPRSSRCGIVGPHGDALKMKIVSPPVDGRANDEVVAFLAATLGIKKDRVSIVSGHTSRQKTVAITGCRRQDLEPYVATAKKQGE